MADSDHETRPFLDRFGALHLRQVGELVDLAREVTGEHFRMGLDEARHMPYEVRTLTHLDEQEIHDDEILADIVRYQYQERRFGRRRDLYHVNLQDHNILKSLQRQSGRVEFAPLLLYVLTHEIVHVIRFVKFMAPFHLEPASRDAEERKVHGLTRRILAKVPLGGMPEVLTRYQHLASNESSGGRSTSNPTWIG